MVRILNIFLTVGNSALPSDIYGAILKVLDVTINREMGHNRVADKRPFQSVYFELDLTTSNQSILQYFVVCLCPLEF